MNTESSTSTQEFLGHRIQVDTSLSFEEVRSRLGDLSKNAVKQHCHSWR